MGSFCFASIAAGQSYVPTPPTSRAISLIFRRGITFVTAQLHGEDLRVTVGATVTLNGTPVNREFEITDEGLLAPIRIALLELQEYSGETTMQFARDDAHTHQFNSTPEMQETLQMIRDNEQAQEDR
jgi:hypothetical protein